MNGTRTRTCKHPGGCDRPLKSRDFCRPHWERLKKTGDLGPATLTRQIPAGSPCVVQGCDRFVSRESGRGMCGMHYSRWLRHGDPVVVAKRGGPGLPGEQNPNWSGEGATYSAAHARVRSLRGSASRYQCTDCDGPALHWSYNHQDLNERTDPGLGRYSSDPRFYEPRCVPCHSRFDRAARGLATGKRPD